MAKKAATAAERRHMERVSHMPCLVCDTWPVHVHHVHSDGMKRIGKSNWIVAPLCPEHHQGDTGVHALGHAGFTARYDVDLLWRATQLRDQSPHWSGNDEI